ncbi:MAG: hypothetical protein WEB04_04200 [Dehalococcoidia bacterium]
MKWLVVAAVVAAALGLAANGHAQETPPFLGDADCNDVVASIDAAITLQYGASLSSSVPCPESADATLDDRIDSRDASLMLQMSAGLIAGIVHETMAVEPTGACDVEQTSCTFDAGAEFNVSVVLHSLPRGGTYVAFQTQIFPGGLIYRPTQDSADEIVWPDAAFLVRSPGVTPFKVTEINHGAATSPVPPYPDSSFDGPLVTVTLVCPEQTGAHTIALGSYEPSDVLESFSNTLGSGVLALPASGASWATRMIYSSQVVGRIAVDGNQDGIFEPHETDLPVSQTLTINCV